MCLAIPMEIQKVDGMVATCVAKGISRQVNLVLLEDGAFSPGDYVMVHVGYALQVISVEEAQATWELFDEMVNHDA